MTLVAGVIRRRRQRSRREVEMILFFASLHVHHNHLLLLFLLQFGHYANSALSAVTCRRRTRLRSSSSSRIPDVPDETDKQTEGQNVNLMRWLDSKRRQKKNTLSHLTFLLRQV